MRRQIAGLLSGRTRRQGWRPEDTKRLFSLALVIMAFALAASEAPATPPAQGVSTPQVGLMTGTLTQASLTGTPNVTLTPSATPAHVSNSDQTNGLIIGGVVLVLIIVAGTLGSIRSKSLE